MLLSLSSEESDEDGGQTSGPSARDVKPLQWERSKLRNIKAVLDATYKARMSKRQQRMAAKVTRVAGQCVKQTSATNLPFLGWAIDPELKVSLVVIYFLFFISLYF